MLGRVFVVAGVGALAVGLSVAMSCGGGESEAKPTGDGSADASALPDPGDTSVPEAGVADAQAPACISADDCSDARLCIAGQCSCPWICAGTCVDTATDRLNCGDCNRPCTDKEQCAAGACVPLPTPATEWANWPMPNTPDSGLPNPASYTVGTDTTLDNVTRLEWQRGARLGLTWQEARKYCEDATFGGKTDWRLPTAIELVSILDHGQNQPNIDIRAFPTSEISDHFWSTLVHSSLDCVYTVNINRGALSCSNPTNPGEVRCVR